MEPPADFFEDEMVALIEDCKERLQNEEEHEIAIVVVGPIDQTKIREFLKETSTLFAPRMAPSPRPMLGLNPTDKIAVSIDYPLSLSELTTDQAIKKAWTLHLVQTLVQERIRKVVYEAGGEWVASKETKPLLPPPFTSFYFRQAPQTDPTQLLGRCLAAFQEIKRGGFSDVELCSAKALLQKKLSLYAKPLSHLLLADYLAALVGKGFPAFPLFMTLSEKMLKEEIEMPHVIEMLQSGFKDSDRMVTLTAPFVLNLTEEQLLAFANQYKADAIAYSPQQGGQNSFNQLPLSKEEEEMIYELVYKLGNANKFSELWNNRVRLSEIGNKIRHIHPLRFLGVVYTYPELREAMIKIFGTTIIYNNFFYGSAEQSGFSQKMTNEHKRGNLMPYLGGFSQLVQKNPDQIAEFLERENWIGLVEYVIGLKK